MLFFKSSKQKRNKIYLAVDNSKNFSCKKYSITSPIDDYDKKELTSDFMKDFFHANNIDLDKITLLPY